MENGQGITSHLSRAERIGKLLELAKRDNLSQESYAVWAKLKDLAQSEFSVSSQVARDYAGIVRQKLPVKSSS